jgi:hypothetical protein
MQGWDSTPPICNDGSLKAELCLSGACGSEEAMVAAAPAGRQLND